MSGLPAQKPLTNKIYTGTITTAAIAASLFLPVCGRGRIKDVCVSYFGSITADNLISVLVSGVTCTNGTMTTANAGSVTGTVFSMSPTALNTVDPANGDWVEIRSSGAALSPLPIGVTFAIRETTA